MKEFNRLSNQFSFLLRLTGFNVLDKKFKHSLLTFIVCLTFLSVHISTVKALYLHNTDMVKVVLSLTTYCHCLQVRILLSEFHYHLIIFIILGHHQALLYVFWLQKSPKSLQKNSIFASVSE